MLWSKDHFYLVVQAKDVPSSSVVHLLLQDGAISKEHWIERAITEFSTSIIGEGVVFLTPCYHGPTHAVPDTTAVIWKCTREQLNEYVGQVPKPPPADEDKDKNPPPEDFGLIDPALAYLDAMRKAGVIVEEGYQYSRKNCQYFARNAPREFDTSRPVYCVFLSESSAFPNVGRVAYRYTSNENYKAHLATGFPINSWRLSEDKPNVSQGYVVQRVLIIDRKSE